MSVIACKVSPDRIVLAADSITVRGYSHRTDAKTAKLASINGIVVGGVGYSGENGLMQIFLKTHKPESPTIQAVLMFLGEFSEWKNKRTGESKLENEFIFAFDGKAFWTYDYHVDEIDTHYAIGAGMDFATTALYLGHDPVEAVKIACKLSVFCEEPIITETLPRWT